MQHYELVIRTARAGTSFFIRADREDDAVKRVVHIASTYETPEPAKLELHCNGRLVACEALKALGGPGLPVSPNAGETHMTPPTPKPSR